MTNTLCTKLITNLKRKTLRNVTIGSIAQRRQPQQDFEAPRHQDIKWQLKLFLRIRPRSWLISRPQAATLQRLPWLTAQGPVPAPSPCEHRKSIIPRHTEGTKLHSHPVVEDKESNSLAHPLVAKILTPVFMRVPHPHQSSHSIPLLLSTRMLDFSSATMTKGLGATCSPKAKTAMTTKVMMTATLATAKAGRLKTPKVEGGNLTDGDGRARNP